MPPVCTFSPRSPRRLQARLRELPRSSDRWSSDRRVGVTLVLAAATIAGASASTARAEPAPPPPTFEELADSLGAAAKQPTDVAAATAPQTRSLERRTGALVVDERERADRAGRNDEPKTAERIRRPRDLAPRPVRGRPHLGHPGRRPRPGDGDRAVRRGRRRHPAGQPERASRPTLPTRPRLRRHRRRPARLGRRRRDAATSTSTPSTDAAAGQLLTVDIDARSIGSDLDPVVAVTDAVGRDPGVQRRLAGARQLPAARAAGRRRLLRRRRRLRLAADEPVRLGQRHAARRARAPTT